jgi:hypothetical protein
MEAIACLVDVAVFKTDEGVKAPWRVRFPSASATEGEVTHRDLAVRLLSTSRRTTSDGQPILDYGPTRLLGEQSLDIGFQRVPAALWDSLGPFAVSVRYMLEYFEDYTNFGPDSDDRIEAGSEATFSPFTGFKSWAEQNVPIGF